MSPDKTLLTFAWFTVAIMNPNDFYRYVMGLNITKLVIESLFVTVNVTLKSSKLAMLYRIISTIDNIWTEMIYDLLTDFASFP